MKHKYKVTNVKVHSEMFVEVYQPGIAESVKLSVAIIKKTIINSIR